MGKETVWYISHQMLNYAEECYQHVGKRSGVEQACVMFIKQNRTEVPKLVGVEALNAKKYSKFAAVSKALRFSSTSCQAGS